MHKTKQLVVQQTEELRRQNLSREQVLVRLWEIANLNPEMTRNSVTSQVRALSLIIAIQGLIPDRRAASAQNQPAPQPTTQPQLDASAWLGKQQQTTRSEPAKPGFATSPVEPAAGAPPTPSEPTSANRLSRSETQSPASPMVAPVNRVPSIENNPYGSLRLRL